MNVGIVCEERSFVAVALYADVILNDVVTSAVGYEVSVTCIVEDVAVELLTVRTVDVYTVCTAANADVFEYVVSVILQLPVFSTQDLILR